MRRPRSLLIGLILAAFTASCQKPTPSDYVHGTRIDRPEEQIGLGTNSAGETCTQQPSGERGADVYCGTFQQPSARVEYGGPATAANLPAAVGSGPWRAAIDIRMQCEPPQSTTILGGQPAIMLSCISRSGGWPQVAMVAIAGGSLWRGDAVLPAATAMERSMGVLAGVVSGTAVPPPSQADGLLARRLAARPFTAGDIGAFDQLMTAGTRANLANDPAGAEQAFRSALALQRKVLGPNDPNLTASMLALAVQLSNAGRTGEATQLFAQAAPLVPRSADSLAPARLLHYRGLDAKNQHQWPQAESLLTQAEGTYAAWIPSDALTAGTTAESWSSTATAGGGQSASSLVRPNPALVGDPRARLALVGLIEARRNRALVLRQSGRAGEADALLNASVAMARANGVDRPLLSGRLDRTLGTTASSQGRETTASAELTRSSGRFAVALPGSRALAETELLRAGALYRSGRNGEAVSACRIAVKVLVQSKTGVDAETMAPCLAAYAAYAGRSQSLLSEMFLAAQVAQGGITAQQIAQASARLRANAADPRVGDAIRTWQDATAGLDVLYGQRDAVEQARSLGRPPPDGLNPDDVARRLAEAEAATANADTALQSAAPNYGQLVQQVSPAPEVMAALRPGEAFASIVLSEQGGWTFLLRPGSISVAPVAGGGKQVADLVRRVRGGVELGANGLPKFDAEADQALYAATLGALPGGLKGVSALIVAPSGPLLSVPFSMLLTGPADAAVLAASPWLVRDMAVTTVPAAANFVTLRHIAGTSRAARPWFGFGDFRPIPFGLAERSFPSARCGQAARLLAGLPALPATRSELESARATMGGSGQDMLTGGAFTANAVQRVALRDYRILQFSTHALLPTDLRCEEEPAIVTSAPSGAPDASGALLTTDRILGLGLDADLVILSACNSGGPGGTTAGESLSGLARAFFYSGARSMLVTHWSVNDQAAAFLVTGTLKRLHGAPATGVAAAMRETELEWLEAAAKAPTSLAGHPFFWAPFATVGEGGSMGTRVSVNP